MGCSFRPELGAYSQPPHGGLEYGRLREEGVDPGEILDFSVSTNPFPPCGEVLEAVGKAAVGRYPDPSSGELCAALAGKNGISPDRVLAVNGLAQAISLAAFAFSDRGKRVLVTDPAFGEYAASCRLAGADVVSVRAVKENDFAFPLEGLVEAVERCRPSLVWVCSPNNPTGVLPGKGQIADLLGICGKTDTLLVVDEAYINFAPPGSSVLPLLSENMLVMRSMTKDYGLTGLRLGYVLGDPRLLGAMRSLQPPWSVNACAQAAGLAAVANSPYYETQWALLRDLAARLLEGLRQAGFAPVPSSGNFLLFAVDSTDALKAFLWEHRILVRDCASFGLEGFVRVGVKSAEESERLLQCLREFREEVR